MSFAAVAVTGVSVAGSIFGAIQSSRAQKAQQAILDQQLAQRKTDENRNFMDSTAGKEAQTAAHENLVDQQKNVAGRAAITGASDASVVASNSAAARGYGDTLAKIAGLGTSYQQQAKDRTMTIQNKQMALDQQKAESSANLAANAGQLVGSAVMASGMTSPKGDDAVKKTGGMGFAEGE